jgi:cold shock CspA family protein
LFRINQQKGYGFIEQENKTGQIIFVHISDFSPKISNEDFGVLKGAKVIYSIEKNDKGLQAKRVHIVE